MREEKEGLAAELQGVREEKEGLAAELQGVREEGELLLLQLHQVQEEIERYFLDCQEARSNYRSVLDDCLRKDAKLAWLRSQRVLLIGMIKYQASVFARFSSISVRLTRALKNSHGNGDLPKDRARLFGRRQKRSLPGV